MPTEISEKSAVGSLPAAFCENFEQCGISTIIAARREDSVPPRVRCPTHAPVRDTRTNRVRNTFWRAFRAISVFHQQVRRPQALAIGLEERGYQVRCSADRVTSRDGHIQSLAVDAPLLYHLQRRWLAELKCRAHNQRMILYEPRLALCESIACKCLSADPTRGTNSRLLIPSLVGG